MWKLFTPGQLNNFKCGAIFCLTVSSYAAVCYICGQRVDLIEFPKHFQCHLADNADEPTYADQQFASLNPLDNSIKSFVDEELVHEKEYPSDEKLINLEDLKSNTSHAIVLGKPESLIAEQVVREEETLNSLENEDKDVKSSGEDWKDEETSSSDAYMKNKEEPFACTKCDRCFKSKQGLCVHMTIVHGPKKSKPKPLIHKCDECGKFFRTEAVLATHKIKHTGVACDVCGRKFSQVGALARHKIRHTGVKSYNCDECSKSFYEKQELIAHKKRHAGINDQICEICGKPCFEKGVLTAHMRRHTGERPAKCDVCGKSFFSVHDLNVHAVAHSDLRPFKCDICGGTFQRKKALRVHKKIHNTAEKKHICQVCGKSFAVASGLTAHMRSHRLEQDCAE